MEICEECGQYGRYLVYMTYSVLSLFFIPIFKWNKQYYVKMSCCDTLYQLKKEAGIQIERGQQVHIQKNDLTCISKSNNRYCPHCGYKLDTDFVYCPKCGKEV